MLPSSKIYHEVDQRAGVLLLWRQAERTGIRFNHFFSLEIGNKMEKITEKKKIKLQNILIRYKRKIASSMELYKLRRMDKPIVICSILSHHSFIKFLIKLITT